MSLDVSKKFRVVFAGTKGSGPSTGGLSLDDINLSETTCPEHVWRIKDFDKVMSDTPQGSTIYSPRFKSKEGYTFQMGLYPNGKADYPGELGAYAHLVSGDDATDAGLKWPCPWKQMTMMLMDQNADIRRRMSNQRSVTADPTATLEGKATSCVSSAPLTNTPKRSNQGSFTKVPIRGICVYRTARNVEGIQNETTPEAVLIWQALGVSTSLSFFSHLRIKRAGLGRPPQIGDAGVRCRWDQVLPGTRSRDPGVPDPGQGSQPRLDQGRGRHLPAHHGGLVIHHRPSHITLRHR